MGTRIASTATVTTRVRSPGCATKSQVNVSARRATAAPGAISAFLASTATQTANRAAAVRTAAFHWCANRQEGVAAKVTLQAAPATSAALDTTSTLSVLVRSNFGTFDF